MNERLGRLAIERKESVLTTSSPRQDWGARLGLERNDVEFQRRLLAETAWISALCFYRTLEVLELLLSIFWKLKTQVREQIQKLQ